MTTLIIVRHGQSMANIEGFFAGNIDIPLSPLGFEQAERTATYIAENFKIDKVYASDLSRAFETGRAIADKTGAELIPEVGFREIFAGVWEGKSFDELDHDDAYVLWKRDIGLSKATGGESMDEVLKRSIEAFIKVAEENDGKVVAIATHAHPIRTARCAWKNLPLSEMKNIPWVSNASITIVEYENGKFTLKVEGFDEHLADCRTNLPTFV